MRVFVVGATGALGRTVLAELLSHSHKVAALARSQDKATLLAGWGVEAIPGDILAPASFQHALQGIDVVCNLASAVPAPHSPRTAWLMNDVLMQQGTRGLLASALRVGVRYFVQQSSLDLYLPGGGAWLDEQSAVAPPQHLRAVADAEEMVAQGGIPFAILRAGRYYGQGSLWTQQLAQAASAGGISLGHRGVNWVSPLHLFDMAKAIRLCLEQQPQGRTYNVCDDFPMQAADLLQAVAAAAGVPLQTRDSAPRRPGWRASNALLRKELGFSPYYPRAVEVPGELAGLALAAKDEVR